MKGLLFQAARREAVVGKAALVKGGVSEAALKACLGKAAFGKVALNQAALL